MTGSLAGSDAIVYNVVADCNCTSGCLESQEFRVEMISKRKFIYFLLVVKWSMLKL